MGIRSFSVALSVLLISSLVDGAAARAIVARATTSSSATGPSPTKLVGVSNSALGASTDDPSLRQAENWYWGPDDSFPYANLTGTAQDNNQRVLAMDRFSNYLTAVTCSSSGVSLKFKDRTSYTNSKSAWSWIENTRANNVILVVESGHCGSTRQPYQIFRVDYDDSSMSVSMMGNAREWVEAFPAYNLHVNSKGLVPKTSSLAKRLTVSKDFSLDLTHNFDGTLFSQTVDDVTFELDCVNCGTAGTFDLDINIVPFVIPPHLEGTVTLTSSGVGATLELGLKVSASLQSPITAQFNSPAIILPGGFTIAGVATVGPVLSFGVAASLNTFTAQAELDFGTEMTIPDSSIANLDFTNSKKNKFQGFNPSFSQIGPNINASISATASLTPTIAIGLDISVGGIGASAGLALNAPVLDLSFEADADSAGGVCGNPDADFGVQFGVGLEASLDAFAGFEPIASVPNQVAILSTSTQLFSTCITIAGATASAAAAATTVNVGAAPTSAAPSIINVSAAPTGAASSTINVGAAPTGAASSTINVGAAPTGAASSIINVDAAPTGAASSTINVDAAPTGAASSIINDGAAPTGAASSIINEGAAPTGAASSIINDGAVPTSAPVTQLQATAFSNPCCGNGCPPAVINTETPFTVASDGSQCQATGPGGADGGGIVSMQLVTNSACTANFFSDSQCSSLVVSEQIAGFGCFTTQSGVAGGIILTQDQADAALFVTINC